MGQDPHTIKVFVSSTSEDLKPYRAVARNVVLDLGWHPQMMEHWTADSRATVTTCTEKLAECQLLLLLVAWRRGWVPTVEQGGNGRDSVTALEHAFAQERGIPVLTLFANDRWPGNLWEEEPEARAWVREFRGDLNKVATFFGPETPATEADQSLPAFRAELKNVLLEYRTGLLKSQERSRGRGEGLDFFDSARESLLAGRRIPFVGAEIYGQGALSSRALVEALTPKPPPEENLSLVTAAEYRERYQGSREEFLRVFAEVLRVQTAEAGAQAAHELLLRLEPCPLLVSVSHDLALEQALDEAGNDYVLVTHVQRAYDAVHEGKILVIPSGGEPMLQEADRLELPEAERVIYKPLGSPLLHDRLDEDLELDTVVVTETDHLAFLSRLDDQHRGVPARFRRLFRRFPLLFLGYALDAWHYRLVMHVFQSVERGGRPASVLAIRTPDTPMEEMAWKRLGADLISMDANTFAAEVMSAAGGPRGSGA